MLPHWYSADPLIQRRLISLFLHSLASNSSITIPTSTQFESEIFSTRSPYDVASVLRWAFRHFKPDAVCLGNDIGWYHNFFNAEKDAGYPLDAFSQYLVPQLPASHVELLRATLDLFSSLAAHAEANGISGSKLSKMNGLWLLEGQRIEDIDGWSTFYERWDQAGRRLEHIFLASIR